MGLYNVVPTNEAHVRVMFDKEEEFSSRIGNKTNRSTYWELPWVTKVTKLPLTNFPIIVKDVKLNDENMAKFKCNIAAFVRIDDPILASRRTSISKLNTRYAGRIEGLDTLNTEMKNIIEGVIRTVGTSMPILDIYKDREKLVTEITKQMSDTMKEWGLAVVNVEMTDIMDDENSTIISDIEAKRAEEIKSDARVRIAEQQRRAEISEAENKRDAENTKAKTEEEWRTNQILKDQNLAIKEQEKRLAEEKAKEIANTQAVEAQRKLEVGIATVKKEEKEQQAIGEKLKLTIEAEGKAQQTLKTGNAEADIIKAKALAEANGVDALAAAQKKFDASATRIEALKAYVDVQSKYAEAYQAGLTNANITVVSDTLGSKNILSKGLLGNVTTGAGEGASLQAMMATLGQDDPSNLGNLIKSLTDGRTPDVKPAARPRKEK